MDLKDKVETRGFAMNQRDTVKESRPKLQPTRITSIDHLYDSTEDEDEDELSAGDSEEDDEEEGSARTAPKVDPTHGTAVAKKITSSLFSYSDKFTSEPSKDILPKDPAVKNPPVPIDNHSTSATFTIINASQPINPRSESSNPLNLRCEASSQKPGAPNTISEALSKSANHSTIETPIKCVPMNHNARPNPCHSHKNIFDTPQNQMRKDLPKAQTPASIFSHWSYNNMAHTPKNMPPISESVGSVRSQTDYKNGDGSRVRRPLLETKADHQKPIESAIHNVKSVIPLAQESKENIIYSEVSKVSNVVTNPPNVSVQAPTNPRNKSLGKIIRVKGKDYVVLGSLGRGMAGDVIRVQDCIKLELRAIKIVDLSKLDKENAKGCVQEIRMLYKLQAPCIIKMYDYEIKHPYVYVVMEMGDTDLSSCIKSTSQDNKLPMTMILHYWVEMLQAVKHIHDNGVIHSDLKPANFLLVRGRLKLIDFGISSNLNGDMTSVVKNTSVGTLNYISPESLMNVNPSDQDCKYKINFKSDVWSLGCILYSLIFGRTPFQHIHQNWARMQAIMDPNTKISYSLPNHLDPVPEVLIQVLRKCLQFNPKDRPSVAELLKIPYISVKKPVRNIPTTIIKKIKGALNEEEWSEFIQIMEENRE